VGKNSDVWGRLKAMAAVHCGPSTKVKFLHTALEPRLAWAWHGLAEGLQGV
jgi:hypothetical protein